MRFPFAPLELPPYFRGKVTINPALCRGCGLCVRDCPAFALEMEHEGRDKFLLIYYADRCAYCGQCETCSIALTNEFVHAAPQRDALLQVMVEQDNDAPSD